MLYLYFILLFQNTTPNYIEAYHDITDKNQELQFIERYKNSKDVSEQAYVISLQMKQAEYKIFPWAKLSIFNTGKSKLEALISENPENIDLRYVRLVIQEQLPKLLNYHAHIETDKAFLQDLLNKPDHTDYLDSYILENTSL